MSQTLLGRYMLLLSLLATLLLPACGRDKAPDFTAEIRALEQEVKTLSTRITKLQIDLTLEQMKSPPYETATFDPSTKGYGRIETTSGFFLVSVEDAKPYLDGYKLVLHIGNPQSVRYSGFKIKAKWGAKFKPDGDDYAKWASALQEKEVAFTETLEPAVWNVVTLVLSPATSASVGYLELGMSTSQVKMAIRR